MKSPIPPNYPRDMRTDEIEDTIHQFQKYITVYATAQNTVLGSTYWMQIIALGQAEINDRMLSQQLANTQRLADETNKLRKENNRSGKINLGLSVITILLAIVSTYFGFQTIKSEDEKDFEIKKMEMMNHNAQVLKQVSDRLQEQDLKLRKMEIHREMGKSE